MKKLFIIVCLIFVSITNKAEDIIQVLPRTVDVSDVDDCYFEIALENTFDVKNLQFDLLLPDGIEFEEADMEVDEIRIPYTGSRRKTFLFTFDTNVLSSGYTRYMFTPHTDSNNELAVIPTGSGPIMRIYFTTTKTISSGVYPILMENILLVKSVEEGGQQTSTSASSYLSVTGNNSTSTATDIDLSGMTGYVPSFVVEQLNSDIAGNTNLRSLNLSGTTLSNLGAALSVPDNDNLLWYTSDKASLNRTFKGEQWNTVCLPFTLQTSYLKASTVVKEMADYDGEATITLGDVTTMETGKPYLIYSSTDGQLIKDVTISNPIAVSNEPSTTSSNSLTMRGTYQEATVKSDGGYTRYGFTNGKFVMLGTGAATVPPFRAYLEYLGKSSTRSINIAGDGTTGINSTISDDESNGPLYDLRGVMMNEGQQNKGIFVRNGKKQILK